jgi:deazaflavin-dependent oxidoreductase (nitroreductase family)
MPKPYQVTGGVRFANWLMSSLIRLGAQLPHYSLMTVVGRKSGKARTLPVQLVEQDGKRWLVSPYGEVNWVKNARAAGRVTLYRQGKSEEVRLRELEPADRAPILKQYTIQVPIVRPYFDAAYDAPVEAFAAEAANHTVFLIETDR